MKLSKFEVADVLLYLQIRHWTKGRFLWLRSSGSTAISLLVDTMIVVSVLTLFDVLPEKEFMTLIKGSYGFKLLCTVLNIPLFYGFVRLYKAKFHRRWCANRETMGYDLRFCKRRLFHQEFSLLAWSLGWEKSLCCFSRNLSTLWCCPSLFPAAKRAAAEKKGNSPENKIP